jgi:hypothetical protein
MQGYVSDLIKEEGALVGDFKFALPAFMGIGEGPFTCPKSSLSNNDSFRAPMSTLTMTSFDLGDNLWISWAISSLPVPFSP